MTKLPKQIDPVVYARQQRELKGELPLRDMVRVQKIADQLNAVASIDLTFDRDPAGFYAITGVCAATVQLVCQRCNKVVEKQVIADVSLSPVISEAQVKSLPKNYDPLVTGGETVCLMELVEDELLLALPMVPTHREGDCPVNLPDYLI